MAITINSLSRIDGITDRCRGSVAHQGHLFDAIVFGAYDRLLSILRNDVTAEYELINIVSADCGLPKDESFSGIFAFNESQIVVDGVIHNEIEIDGNNSIFDIYIKNGADFLAVTTQDIGWKPEVGSRIRIAGKQLHVHPCFH